MLRDPSLALDLEAIGALADGRIVVLSERLGALLDEDGLVAVYDRCFAEFGGRGLEGLAIRALPDGGSRVAVLWEGGYPDTRRLPSALRERAHGVALRPALVIHDLAADERGAAIRLPRKEERVELQVPLPPGDEPTAQRFRAADLVWTRLTAGGEWGLLVLISSGWAAKPAPGSEEECPARDGDRPRRWCYKWLQRFTTAGLPYGEPCDLDPLLPGPLVTANWEGLGWYEPGRSLVLVYDEKVEKRRLDPQEALVVPVPEGWRWD